MIIFPAIDLMGGQAVRLTQGAFEDARVYNADPVAQAMAFAAAGAEWIHLVDLDGAKAGHPVHLEVLRQVAAETGLPVQFGGGLRTPVDMQAALEAGAARVIVGTRLTQDLDTAEALFAQFGEGLVAGLDARNGEVATHGWQEGSGQSILDLARQLVERGATRFIYTDIARDGVLGGPDLSGTVALLEATGVPVIASGGVAELSDLEQIAATKLEGVIVGKALYEGRFTLQEALRVATART